MKRIHDEARGGAMPDGMRSLMAYCKLSAQQVRWLEQKRMQGYTNREVAEFLHVSVELVRKAFRHCDVKYGLESMRAEFDALRCGYYSED